jgi:predicted nucleic acid-binding protein
VAANATCIITEDRHFKVLEQLNFPKISAMNIAKFEDFYQSK